MPDPSHAPTADWPGAALVAVVRSALPRDAAHADGEVRRLIDAQVRSYAEAQAERQAQGGMRPLQLTRPGGLMHKAALDVTGRRIPCPPGREDEMLALLASDLRAHVSESGGIPLSGGRLEMLRGEVAVRPVRDFFEAREAVAVPA